MKYPSPRFSLFKLILPLTMALSLLLLVLVTIPSRLALANITHQSESKVLVGGSGCWATPDDGTTVFMSGDANAVQQAVQTAVSGATVKVAGTCVGVQSNGGLSQTLYISQSVTVQGGYTHTNWLVSEPVTYPTKLDAQENGRVIYVESGAVVLDSLNITGGYTDDEGGGIYQAQGNLAIVRSNVMGNTAVSAAGGVKSLGNLAVDSSTIAHNNGSGLNVDSNGQAIPLDVTVINSTIAHNSDIGLHNVGTSLDIINSTIARNLDAGVMTENSGPATGTTALSDSIMAQNGNSNCTGSGYTSLDYNLADDGSCSLNQGNDNPNTAVFLSPLQDNGGPTWTMALQKVTDNANVFAGNCAGGTTTTDQRGVSRPQYFTCDIGAYELDGNPFQANDDHIVTTASSEVSFDVFANDFLLGPTPPWSIVGVVSPTYGTLTHIGDGDFSYQPNPGIIGNDVFTYQVTNMLYTDTASVFIAINHSNPADPDLALDWLTTLSPSAVATADVNDDGTLDLALIEGTVQLIMNQNGILPNEPDWQANESDNAIDLAWGDVDLDGDLDLAVGIANGPNKLYRNEQGVMNPDPIWSSLDNDNTKDIVWGDIDGDGWLELIAGSATSYRIYANTNGSLSSSSTETMTSASRMALGDMDGDGMLDLALGSAPGIISVFLNMGGTFAPFPAWQNQEAFTVPYLQWGDMDNDNDLDLIAADLERGVQIFDNVNGILESAPSFSWGFGTVYFGIGDVNSDSYLDLFVDSAVMVCPPLPCVSRGHLLLNEGGTVNPTPVYQLIGSGSTPNGATLFADMDSNGSMDLITLHDFLQRLANVQTTGFIDGGRVQLEDEPSGPLVGHHVWGDMDGDDDLDLALINNDSHVYLNENGSLKLNLGLQAEIAWTGPSSAKSAAWGDMNGDGRLDLAIGRNGANHVYLNEGGMLTTTVSWSSSETADTSHLAWGDVDGDGDLDLATADNDALRLYRNLSGTLAISATWMVTSTTDHREVAWGDVNNDGNLDLAVAGDDAVQLYLNNNGLLSSEAAWSVTSGSSLDFGDMDNDGDLDLAVGRSGPNAVYENINGTLQPSPVWTSLDNEIFNVRIEWIDINNNGYPGLLIVNRWSFEPPAFSRLYVNTFGSLEQTSSMPILSDQFDGSVVDIDADGDKDIVYVGGSPICVFCGGISVLYNQAEQPSLSPLAGSSIRTSISLYSDEATTFNGQTTQALATADNYALAHIRSDTVIPISYTTSVAAGAALQVRGSYSLNGGGDWQPAVATSDTITVHVAFDGSPQVYKWDTFASGFFGQSDNVIFRLELVPSGHGWHGTPAAQQRPFFSAQTYPFRVRGTQVRVLSGTIPVANAQVYRLPAGQTTQAQLMVDDSGQPLRTNLAGYLQGRGQINLGDTLYAILPITHTDSYTLYHTNGTPTESGMDGHVMIAPGEQTLVVSPDNPLMLFNPTVSLEWDSRNDPTYLSQLTSDLQRTSEVLFDITNGQVALGQIRVQQAKENWTGAHVLIYAANDVRPSAAMGGIVTEPVADFITVTGVISDAYLPGQVHMGPTWSRFGDPDANLGEDWPRALAHELGHFLLFLPDNYLGIENGRLISTDCFGSFMTDAYDDEYSEFLTETGWVGPCLQTIAEQVSGRTDWETITQFYPWLHDNPLLSGPSQLPLAITDIQFQESTAPPIALPAPFFSLRDSANEPLFVANGEGAGYLIKNWDTPALDDDYVVALGAPVGDQMEARGAAPGDRLCVYDYGQTTTALGCTDVGPSEGELVLLGLPDWQPQIEIGATAVTATNQPITQTLALIITVTQATTSNLHVQVMPVTGFSTTFPIASTSAPLHPLDPANPITHTQFLTLPYPTLEVFVRVWAENLTPTHEIMTQYLLGKGWGANRASWGANRASWGANRASWGANRASWGAPVASGNGQVIIFNLDDVFGDTGVASLQALSNPPLLPQWMTLVGQAYRFESAEAFTRTISFNYLQTDVPGGNLYESFLQVYYSADNGQTWQPLVTALDTEDNLAAATMPAAQQGNGLYALVSTIPLPALAEGWNLFTYPLPGTRTVSDIFASIEESFTSAYHQQDDLYWRLYDVTVVAAQPEFAPYLNDLTEIAFSEVYWVYATEAVTPYISLPEEGAMRGLNVSSPPATYYGWVSSTAQFTPTVGMGISATVNGQLCGHGVVTDTVGTGQLAYKVQVAADVGDGCGALGQTVVFYINGQRMAHDTPWDNSQAWYHPLYNIALEPTMYTVYLPLISKP